MIPGEGESLLKHMDPWKNGMPTNEHYIEPYFVSCKASHHRDPLEGGGKGKGVEDYTSLDI